MADQDEFARIAIHELLIARSELTAVIWRHVALWTIVFGAVALVAFYDVGGLSTLARSATSGWPFLLPALSLLAAAWIGYSNYRRECELIEFEHQFLRLEIESLRRGSGG